MSKVREQGKAPPPPAPAQLTRRRVGHGSCDAWCASQRSLGSVICGRRVPLVFKLRRLTSSLCEGGSRERRQVAAAAVCASVAGMRCRAAAFKWPILFVTNCGEPTCFSLN